MFKLNNTLSYYHILSHAAYGLKVVFRMVLDTIHVFSKIQMSSLVSQNWKRKKWTDLSYELGVKYLFRLPVSFVQKHFRCKFLVQQSFITFTQKESTTIICFSTAFLSLFYLYYFLRIFGVPWPSVQNKILLCYLWLFSRLACPFVCLRRRRSKPSVYSVCELVHNIVFESRRVGQYKWFSRVRGPAATQATRSFETKNKINPLIGL